MTPACFEPTIDYVVAKIPKWQFEKFPGTDEGLGPQMKSVGEAMAIGRTFKEALGKGIRSLETGRRLEAETIEPRRLTQRLVTPHPERLRYLQYALQSGYTVKQVARLTGIDPWFLHQLKEVGDEQAALEQATFVGVTPEQLRAAKRLGFSDERLASLWKLGGGAGATEKVRALRTQHRLAPV